MGREQRSVRGGEGEGMGWGKGGGVEEGGGRNSRGTLRQTGAWMQGFFGSWVKLKLKGCTKVILKYVTIQILFIKYYQFIYGFCYLQLTACSYNYYGMCLKVLQVAETR